MFVRVLNHFCLNTKYYYQSTNHFHGKLFFLGSWQFFTQPRNSPHLMEPESLLPSSQEPANCPYPEPDQSNALPHILFLWKYILSLSSLLHVRLPTDLILSQSPPHTLLGLVSSAKHEAPYISQSNFSHDTEHNVPYRRCATSHAIYRPVLELLSMPLNCRSVAHSLLFTPDAHRIYLQEPLCGHYPEPV